MGDAALPHIDAPRRADRAVAPTTRPATAITPVAMVGRSEIVGGLEVVSEPSGAEVSINGVRHGHTPLKIENVVAGTRVVRLELPGYARWSWAVTVAANKLYAGHGEAPTLTALSLGREQLNSIAVSNGRNAN